MVNYCADKSAIGPTRPEPTWLDPPKSEIWIGIVCISVGLGPGL